MLKVLCVVSSKFCKFTYRYRESVAGAVARSPRRISKKAMEGDECIFVGAGVARRAAHNAGRCETSAVESDNVARERTCVARNRTRNNSATRVAGWRVY